MYTCYIYDYKDGETIVKDPICIYDKRSPVNDMRVASPLLSLADSSAGSFSFVLPITHFMYDKIVEKLTKVRIYDDDEVIFEGPIVSNEKDWYMNRKVVAEGYATYLNDSTQPRAEYFNISMKEYLEALIENHNNKFVTTVDNDEVRVKQFVIGDVDVQFPEEDARSKRERIKSGDERITTRSDISTYEYTQYESTMSYLLSLKSRCKGHFIFTRINENLYKIDYLKELPLDENAQCIAIGENMLDYNESNDYSLMCTSVLPVASTSSGVDSEIGDVLGIIPNITVGETSMLSSITSADFTEAERAEDMYVYVLNNSEHRLYKVTGFNDDTTIKYQIVTDHFELALGAALGDTGTTVIPMYFYGRAIRAYKSYEYFPRKVDENFPNSTEGSTAIYYYDKANNHFYQWSSNAYSMITGTLDGQLRSVLSFHTFRIDNIEGINPPVHRFYVDTRSYPFSDIDGHPTDYLLSVTHPAFIIDSIKMESGKAWPSLKDEVIDISYSADGAHYYAAHELYVAGWGGSLPTKISREAYYYDTKNYSIGPQINLSSAATKLTKTGIFWDGHFYDAAWHWEIGLHTEERYDESFSVLKIDAEAVVAYIKQYLKNANKTPGNNDWLENVHYKLYISTRTHHFDDDWVSEQDPDYDRNDGPLWYATDDSDQILYYENKDVAKGVLPSVIYYEIDLSTKDLYGAKWIYVACWGATIPVTANYEIPQSGSLTDYMTVETASDYYIKLSAEQVGDECLHTTGSLYVESPSLIEKYGRIEKKVEFNNVSSPEMLLEKAVDFLVKVQFGEVVRTIKGIDLHNQNVNIEPFRISTKVPTYSPFHNLNKNMDLVGLDIYLDSPADNSITLNEQITIEDRMEEV